MEDAGSLLAFADLALWAPLSSKWLLETQELRGISPELTALQATGSLTAELFAFHCRMLRARRAGEERGDRWRGAPHTHLSTPRAALARLCADG